MVLALALLVPALYLLALRSRPAVELMQEMPPAVTVAAIPATAKAGAWSDLDEARLVRARLTTGDKARWIEIELQAPLQRPDVLIYWTSDNGDNSGTLPTDSWLLGTLTDSARQHFLLPVAIPRSGGGQLILYSLGHQEVVASGVISTPGSLLGEEGR